jgi:uncharacterized protein YndB with AHSA1/START domain
MELVEIQTIMRYPIEDVFALTIDLEKAPRWHNIFTAVQQLTPNPIGPGSRWKINYGVGSFVLEIIDYQPPNCVIFKGSTLIFGTIPNFTVELEVVAEGTRLRYVAHPYVPPLFRPLVSVIGPPWGKRDLARYFREFETMLAA